MNAHRTNSAALRELKSHGKHFTSFLNATGGTQGLCRTLVDLTIACSTIATGSRQQEARLSSGGFGPLSYRRKARSIVARIEPPSRLDVVDFDDDEVREGKRAGIWPVWSRRPLKPSRESLVVMGWLNIFASFSEGRVLARLRRCPLPTCNKYFFPLRSDGRYCSKACLRTHFMHDPKRKALNAADQKIYYYTQKVLNLAKLAAVNSAHLNKYRHAQRALKLAKRAKKRLGVRRKRK